MSKYTLEFKLRVIQFYLSEYQGTERIAKHFGIPRASVQHWLAVYKKHGGEGLKPQAKQFTAEFKRSVVAYVIKNQCSFREAGIHFNILFSNVASWHKIVLSRGFSALTDTKKGRPKIMAKSSKKNSLTKPDHEKTQAELLTELEYVRAENAYLKKLDALLRERAENEQKTKQK